MQRLTVLLLLSALLLHVPHSHAAGTLAEASAQVRQPAEPGADFALVRIGTSTYRTELAQTPSDQARGLMYRAALPRDRGMLFVFGEEAPRSFWMKNTLIPLDIIFITKDRKIDSFHTMSPCHGDPCPTYRSAGKVMYALEVNAGEVARNRFSVGDKVLISMPSPRKAR